MNRLLSKLEAWIWYFCIVFRRKEDLAFCLLGARLRRQIVHMKCQALFSLKKVSSAVVVISALSVNCVICILTIVWYALELSQWGTRYLNRYVSFASVPQYNPCSVNHKYSRRHFKNISLFFRENKAWHFMWIVCLADDSHEMSSIIFSGK